jgi:hypothetical protein
MGRNTGMPTGRPYIYAYDTVGKQCPKCGITFYLRDKPMQSLGRFSKRKFCSRVCVNASRRQTEHTPADPVSTFWSRVSCGSDEECWEWQGKVGHNGYGLLEYERHSWRAHRLAFTLTNGEIPQGLLILHSCDNRRCCNPHHLRAGTAKENWQDAIDRGRMKRGIPLEIALDDIFEGTLEQAAKRLGVSPTTVFRKRKQLTGGGRSSLTSAPGMF